MKFGCVVTVVEIHQQTDSPSVTQHTDDVDVSYLSGPALAQLRSQVDTRMQTEKAPEQCISFIFEQSEKVKARFKISKDGSFH